MEVPSEIGRAEGSPQSDPRAQVLDSGPLFDALDRSIALNRTSGGSYAGTVDAEPGQWTLTLEVNRNDARVYRSVSRLVLK